VKVKNKKALVDDKTRAFLFNFALKFSFDLFFKKNIGQNNSNSSLLNYFYNYVKLLPNKTEFKQDLNDVIQDMERKLTK
jgi:hypothetical protein